MAEQSEPVGPVLRPDSAPIHTNAIRAFREELRLNRDEFSALLEVCPDTERGWEIGASTPRGKAAIKIAKLAKRNCYPLTLEDIFSAQEPNKKKKRRRLNGAKKAS